MPQLKDPALVLDEIAQLLNGKEWDVDFLDDIANILRAAGFVVREYEPEPPEPDYDAITLDEQHLKAWEEHQKTHRR